MDTTEHLRDKVEDPTSSMPLSLHNADNLQGIYVYQLPFPGTLPEKAQREQLAAVVRKYSKIVEIRFDAVPNNPDVASVQAGRRYQLPPLSRRALIVFQKISLASFEALLAELNKQVMSQCHLSASTAKSEHISALIAMRNAASGGHNATKAHQTVTAKNATTASAAEQSAQQQQSQQLFSSKRPMTLLKIQPPAPAVKAFAMDSQTHTQPDPFHKNASRTLYVKHLDNTITEEELKVRYGKFGHILDIEVKNRNTMAPYAFIQFTNIESVASAIKAFNQQFEECGGARQKKYSNLHWWGNTIVTSRLWIGRLPPNCGEQYLMSKMRVVLTQPDDVTQVIYDANFNEAIVMFVGHESTQIAFNKVKNRNITFQPERSSVTEPAHHVHVDFCSEKLHDYFIDRLYGKNTDPLLSEAILAPPPDPPKCLASSHNQPKKSPSPPPDPSIESVVGHCIKMGRNIRETTHSNSMGEETQCHREKTTRGKSQDNSERVKSATVRQARSNSSSTNTSTDTYSQSPRKRWRHPPQPAETNEFSGSRHKVTTKKPVAEAKQKWERKHRSQRSTERRRESRVEKREKRCERRRSRTRQTTGTARRTEGERSGENALGGDKSKRGDNGGKPISETNKRSKTTSKVEKYKGRSKERAHAKTSSNSGTHLLPPPPAPPLRIEKSHDQHKRRRSSTSSSDSHSSCTCSSCSSNSSSNSRTNSLSENSDSELSSSENEGEREQPSPARRSHRSRKEGFVDESSQVDKQQPTIKRETPNSQTVLHNKNEQLANATNCEAKATSTKNPAQNAECPSEKKLPNETKEEKSKDKKGEEQSQRKDQTATTAKDETASKKTTSAVPSLPVQTPQTVGKAQVPKPSHRTTVCIPLEVQSSPSPSDPRLIHQRQQQQPSGAVTDSMMCLDLPRFILKMRSMVFCDNRPSSSAISGEGANLTEELAKTSPLKAVPPPANDWIKHEPELNAQIELNLKTKPEELFASDAKVEKKPTTTNTLILMASITERIKFVENGIAEFRNTVQLQSEQINASSNFDQIESEVSRIKTELTNGVPLELLEQSIAQNSAIIALINSSADGVGRQLQSKASGDSFQTSNGPEFIGFTDEVEKCKRSDETDGGGLLDRRCSFLSEPDMPTRSFSLSSDHHIANSSAKPGRFAHEKEQQFISTATAASPLPKQSADSGNLRKPKQLADSSPNQSQPRNTAGIPKLKEIKLDRKPSAVSSANVGDPWTTVSISTSLSSLKKDKEVKERREHRSESIGHLPTTSTKEPRKELGVAKANVQQTLKKEKMMAPTMKPQQKQPPKEEKKTDSSGGGHAEEQKKQHKLAKTKHAEIEPTSDADKQHKKQKRKKRPTEQTTSSSSEESLDESELFNEFDIEEQKRMLKAIKSGVGFGLSMYDRVKRRSSQRPDDEQKKKTALEVLKTKQAKKKKEFSRVRLSSTSTDSEEKEHVPTTESAQPKTEASPKRKLAEEGESETSSEEDGEQKNEENDDPTTRAETKQQTQLIPTEAMSTKRVPEVKVANTAVLTIRRPEIAPRKPFMDERKLKEEEGAVNTSPSSAEEQSANSSESESEAEDGELDAGDRAIEKLKNVLSRYRKSSESSMDEAKDFNEKLAKVISIATEGCQTHTHSANSHSEKSDSSSSSVKSSSLSESDNDNESTKERPKGVTGMSKTLPTKKKVKHLSMEDVFGADSSEESSCERIGPPPRGTNVECEPTSTPKHKTTAESSNKNETTKKETSVPKIKIETENKESSENRVEKERAAQNKSLLTASEQGKRTRVSSVSSVSSVEQKRFKEAKSPSVTTATIATATPLVRDRSKSDATALKMAQQRQKITANNKSEGTIDTVLSTESAVVKKNEMDKKIKQTKTTATVGTPKGTISKTTTTKKSQLLKELAKRKIARNREDKRLNKAKPLKRAGGTEQKGQTMKKAKTETRDKEAPREKQEELEAMKDISDSAAQSLVGGSNISKTAEGDEIVQQQQNICETMDSEETEQKEKETQREKGEEGETNRKTDNETNELLNIAAAEQMAENEFEIIDSGKVHAAEKDKEKKGAGETKQIENVKENEEEKERKMEENEERKKRDDEKKQREDEEKKRREEEKEEQRRKREQDEEKRQREEEEEKKKRGEEEVETNEMPMEEEDEAEMEAELLRRMEERNEEEEAVASLGLQTKVELTHSQDINRPLSNAICHMLGQTHEKSQKILEGPFEKGVKRETVLEEGEKEAEKNFEEEGEETEPKPEDKNEETELKQEESGEQSTIREERKCQETEETTVLREQGKTASEETTSNKNVGFKFETIERRASNESVDSHMAGVGNGFVEVDAEHLRQQKREQDALERLAEERRRTEETVKRMDETVDAVATNSTLLHNESATLTSPNFAQQRQQQHHLTIDSFHPANQQQSVHQMTTAPTEGTFLQQREGGVIDCDYYYPTNMAMGGGQSQNQQQRETVAIVQAVPANPPISIQSQYIQQQPQHQQTVHSLQQQHFPLPSTTEDVLLTMSATGGASVGKTPVVTTATIAYHPPIVPTTAASVHHQQQSFHGYGHGQLQQQPQFQQQQTNEQQQQPQFQQQQTNEQQQQQQFPQLQKQQQLQQQHQLTDPLQQQQQNMASASEQHHQTASTMGQPIQQNTVMGSQTLQQSPIVQNQQQGGLIDRRLEIQTQQQHQQMQQHQNQQQQLSRPEHPQVQQRQQFQMQHIVQAPTVMQKQQKQQQQFSAIATTSAQNQLPQQAQQTKQQNAARQRKAQQQQVPPPMAHQQKQPNLSGQYLQQQQQLYPQQQLQPDTLTAMSTTGLMDHQSLVSLYQHLRDQQMLQQAQQMPSISAAMIAAASASAQFTPATLSKWNSIVTPPSTLAQGGALEELLRHGLLAPQASSFVSPSGGRGAESVGTSAMTAPASFDELFQHKMPNTSSPRGFPQHQPQTHQQILPNVPQRNAAAPNTSQQQQQPQQPLPQHLQISGASAQNKQIQIEHQQRQPHQPVQQQQQIQHQQQIPLQFPQHQQVSQHPIHQQHQQQMQQIQQHQIAQQQQQQHIVHANVPLQPPPQHILAHAETQQQQAQQIVIQNQQKMVKKQSSTNKYPVLWQGQLAMKIADTLVQMHKVCGNETLVQQMNAELSSVNENGIPLLRINQRMRLEHTHLENLIRKMEREDNQLALICLPCGRDREDVVIQTQKMNISFIEYFSSKSAAGIVSSGPTQQPSAMVAHIFPPSDFSRMLLSRNAPDLLRTVESLNAGYLFVILTNK